MMRLLVSCFVVLFAAICTDALSCKDQSGKDVDWFVAYKLPRIQTFSDPLVKDGVAFLYMDANAKKDGWKMTTVGIDIKDQDHFHMMYNDKHATAAGTASNGKEDDHRAHAKGVTVFNQKDGLWLIHSIPGFPPPDTYGYASESKKYGQSLMCITFDTNKSLGELTEQWYRFQLSAYAARLPSEFAQKYPYLGEIAKETSKPPNKAVSLNRTANLQSKGGLKLIHFAKNGK